MAGPRIAFVLVLAAVGSGAAARGLWADPSPMFHPSSLNGPVGGLLCFLAAAAGYAVLSPRER